MTDPSHQDTAQPDTQAAQAPATPEPTPAPEMQPQPEVAAPPVEATYTPPPSEKATPSETADGLRWSVEQLAGERVRVTVTDLLGVQHSADAPTEDAARKALLASRLVAVKE